MSDNSAQMEQWNGRVGASWSRHGDRLDAVLRPIGDATLDALALGAGQRVLEVGCGGGDMTRAIADRVGPAGHVLGVDLSGPLLERARARAEGCAWIELRQADASSAVMPSDRDRLFSRYGVMFFADAVAAFAHLRGTMARGGRMAFACWRPLAENPWVGEAVSALAPFVKPGGPPPDPHAPGPFAFADPARVRDLLTRAGWASIDIAPLDLVLRWTSSGDLDEALDLFAHIGPAATVLRELDEAERPRALDALRAALVPRLAPDGLRFPSASWIVTAKP
jgi:SAM-dependent methyltransferase